VAAADPGFCSSLIEISHTSFTVETISLAERASAPPRSTRPSISELAELRQRHAPHPDDRYKQYALLRLKSPNAQVTDEQREALVAAGLPAGVAKHLTAIDTTTRNGVFDSANDLGRSSDRKSSTELTGFPARQSRRPSGCGKEVTGTRSSPYMVCSAINFWAEHIRRSSPQERKP